MKPSLDDVKTLRARYHLALQALDKIYTEGGGPIYPNEVNAFMATLISPTWACEGSDVEISQQVLENPSEASLENIGKFFTRLYRSERFSSYAWQSRLKEEVLFEAIFDRLEKLILLESARPPISHPLMIAASKQAKVWAVFTLVMLGFGLMIELLRAKGYIARGETATPVYIVAAIFALVTVFCYLVSRRGQAAIAAIRRGEYLVHWRYGGAVTGEEVAEMRRQRCRTIFLLLFIGVLAISVVLGGIGAYMKSDLGVMLNVALKGFGVGLFSGLLFAVPTWFLLGVRVNLTKQLADEVIFTKDGFYRTGQFIPVMSWHKDKRVIKLLPRDETHDSMRLHFELAHYHSLHAVDVYHQKKVTARFDVAVPSGNKAEAEAWALLTHYQS